MRTKTVWTVAAGTTAAVLVPGVAYTLVAGGSGAPQQGPGVIGGEKPQAQPAEVDADGEAADQGSRRDPDVSGPTGIDPAPHQLPAVEEMATASSGPLAVSAVSPLSAVSAASPGQVPERDSSASRSSGTKPTSETVPAPAISADTPDSAPSPVSPPSAVSAGSPDSPDSAD